MSLRICLILTAWYCLAPHWLAGQAYDYRFEQYGMAEGLPHVAIQALHQDQYGYLWIGTWNGLSRYDGYHFENFQPEPQDRFSLAHGTVYDLAESPEGTLWVSTEIGISRFVRNQHQFENFYDSCWNPKPCEYRFLEIEAGPDGNIWASSSLYRLQLIRINQDQRWEKQVSGFFRLLATSRLMWLFSTEGIQLMHPQTGKLQAATVVYPALTGLAGKEILAVDIDLLDRIWFATPEGVFLFDGQRLLAQPGWPTDGVKALHVDRQGGVWLGTQQGLYHQPGGQHQIHHLTHQPNVPHSLSSNEINCLYEDRQGNLWVGTERGGLNKLRNSNRTPFQAVNQGAFGRAQNEISVYALHKTVDGQEIWTGTNAGVFVFDANTRRLKQHLQSQLPESQVRAIAEDDRGNMWIGFLHQGACLIQRSGFQVRSLPGLPPAPGTIRNIQADSSGRMWVAARKLYRFDSAQSKPEIVAQDFHYQQSTLNLYIWDLLFARDGTLWIACNRGILAIEAGQDRISQWVQFDESKVVASQVAFCLHEDEAGILWVGLWGGGLIRYDPVKGEKRRYGTQDGLEARLIYGILEDAQHWLWLSTNQGLVRFDPEQESFVNFTTEDGLVANDFDSGAYTEAADGEFFFGGRNGFVSLYPQELPGDMVRFPPKVRLTSVQLSGEPFPTVEAIESLDTLTVRHTRAQSFEFAFSAFDFSRPGQTRYQYRLAGYEDQWSPPTDQPQVRYTGLEPGEYELLIKASDANGNFGAPSLRLHLHIQPRLLQQGWFRWLLGVLLAASLMGGVYWRMRSLNQRERTLLRYRAALAKQEALAAQFDHHFTFNSLHSIQRFILEQQPQAAVRYVSRFGKLIRRVMQQARETFIPLEEELETLELYLELEQSRARFPFQTHLEVDPALDHYSLELPGMLVQPFVENAIWHGLMPAERPGKLYLRFRKQAHLLRIEIEDDGIGRAASGQLKRTSALKHESRGTQLVQERIATLEALLQYPIQVQIEDLQDPAGQAAGTLVLLHLPLET